MITINIATHKKREQSLKSVVLSLFNQSVKPDFINVYLNDYKAKEWMEMIMNKYDFISFVSAPSGDLGASAKFYFVDEQTEGVYMTLDDDLIPNKDYVKKLSEHAYLYPNAIVGLHGTRYESLPIKSYFHDVKRDTLYCTKALDKDVVVDMLGTGVLAFRVNNRVIPTLKDFPEKNMTDPYLCKWSKDNNVTMVCLSKPKNFVREVVGSQETAIWKNAKEDDTDQTKCINSIRRFNRVSKAPTVEPLIKRLNGGTLTWKQLKLVIGMLKPSTKMVEFGSGISTDIFSYYTNNLISFEHDENFVKPASRLREIKDGWYNLTKQDKADISKCDLLLVDGPKAKNNERYNLPLDILPKNAVIFIDDCHRDKDLEQAHEIAKSLGKRMTLVNGSNKYFAIIE